MDSIRCVRAHEGIIWGYMGLDRMFYVVLADGSKGMENQMEKNMTMRWTYVCTVSLCNVGA